MNITAKYIRKQTNEEGNVEVVLEVGMQFVHLLEQMLKGAYYRIRLDEVKSKRSIEQNSYLWALIHDISEARNTTRATNQDDWEIYLEALERAQAKFEYIAVREEAIPMLKQAFRAVKELNTFTTEKGKDMVQCKVFYGSSKMDAKEMAKLLDTVIDMAQQEGVEMRYYG